MHDLLNNVVLIGALISWAVAVLAKTLVVLVTTRAVAVSDIFGPGGMPSTHTCPVLTTTVLLGFQEGWDSGLFALSLVFASVVMYDASGVRRSAGHHAQAINEIFRHLFEQGRLQTARVAELREILGHRPSEVLVGAVLGIMVALIVQGLWTDGQWNRANANLAGVPGIATGVSSTNDASPSS